MRNKIKKIGKIICFILAIIVLSYVINIVCKEIKNIQANKKTRQLDIANTKIIQVGQDLKRKIEYTYHKGIKSEQAEISSRNADREIRYTKY